jgi:D-alanyl-D-alanine carboxypeptidase/D-alanyl-D-alanine-endopeptidase (penicillin-binding protein 4)
MATAQELNADLTRAMKELQADEQFKHAMISMYVVDNRTNKIIFEKNSEIGLAPASCQKVITSASAFEILKNDYRNKTSIEYDGEIKGHSLLGNIYINASGDPTLGSWRWKQTSTDSILQKILLAFQKDSIKSVQGGLWTNEGKFETQATPNGWTWDDIGNYYGAGARALNWHENQYDMILKPGMSEGSDVKVIATIPELSQVEIVNELKTGKQRSGDQSVIYLPEDGKTAYIRGTIPVVNDSFVISGSMPNAAMTFNRELKILLHENGISFRNYSKPTDAHKELISFISPSLDSINYWFLKRSVNLYGEAFVKTIAYEKTGKGSTEAGLKLIKDLWEKQGIDRSSLHIIDGSGLSPANRVTTHALVQVMQYAKQQSWFPSFYLALPELNGIKMKDGYIGGVRSFTGYITSKWGNEYTFSFIVNNFDGSAGTVREKMWKVLDILK